MTLFSENELLMIALILDEEEEEEVVKKNGYGFIRHGRKGQQKGNFLLYIRN